MKETNSWFFEKKSVRLTLRDHGCKPRKPTTPNLFYKATLTLISKPNTDPSKRKLQANIP